MQEVLLMRSLGRVGAMTHPIDIVA
jgi:hypothetical protein